ncbi:MAG: Integral rane protein TerC [Gammaproteobacteria bacterium]|jgi:tellurite resistance protein TerC|nr:Integral rane protein TerC [Gammaproteobacteria bacterium]
MTTIATWWMWLVFLGVVLLTMAIDLWGCGASKVHRMSNKEALSWVTVWIVLALCFNAFIWWHTNQVDGPIIAKEKATEFLTGFLVEKSLAVDNLFVFLMIFSYFQVPAEYQRRVLLYGVFGAIVLRAVMIGAGAWLIMKAHWILYLFGAFLIFTGIKMLIFANKENKSLEDNVLLKWLKRHLPIAPLYHGEKFFIKQNGKLFFTPMFIVLILIEFSDLVFATDSVPAIFAITQDPFIVLTSNIFAIMGLRAMYFLLASMAERFHLLKYAVAIILLIIGAKMLIEPWFEVSTALALGLVAGILLISVVASLIQTRHRGSR